MARKAKLITDKDDIKDLLNLTVEQAGKKETIVKYFGDFGSGPKYNPYDILEVPAGSFGNAKKNKNAFKTTIGLWIYNKSFIEPISDVLGYINHTVDAGEISKINKILSHALLEDKISLQQFKDYNIQSQVLLGSSSHICGSHTDKIFDMYPAITKKKKELYKKYKEHLDNNELLYIKKFEDELIDWAKEELKDDEFSDLFNSGARSSWGNNFKNMYLTRGAVKLSDESYVFVMESYMDGLDKEHAAAVNDAAVGGPYSRAVNTAEGGYKEKAVTNACGFLKVGSPGSDCGTKDTIKVELTNKNIDDWMYCYIVNSSGNLIEITSDNKDKYIGKTINIRYSALCKSKNGQICEACMGTMYRRIGISNIGLGVMIGLSSLKNASMKKFHNNTLSLFEIKPDEVFM